MIRTKAGSSDFQVCDEARAVKFSCTDGHIVIGTPTWLSAEELATLAGGCNRLIVPISPHAKKPVLFRAGQEALKGISVVDITLSVRLGSAYLAAETDKPNSYNDWCSQLTPWLLHRLLCPRYLWDGEEPPHGFTDFIAAIKAFSIVDEIETEQAIENAILLLSENICGFNAVTVVPSHSKGGNAHAGIFRIAAGLAERSNGKVIDATSCLHRIHTVEKLAGGGDRAKDTHINSIQLRNPDFIKGKKVPLLDDVRCTGNSLAACREILEGAHPKAVHPFALAQSLNDNREDPEITYARVGHRLHMAYQIEHQGLDFEQNREQSALSQLYDFAQ